MNIKELLLATILVVIMFFGLFAGAENQEKYECQKWQEQAEAGYIGYYFTDWQKQQCERHNITLSI